MKRFLFLAHLWTGLVAGLLLVLLGLSGSALVFRADLEHAAVAQWTVPAASQGSARQTLQACVARALRAHPTRELARLVVPPADSGVVEVVLQRKRPKNLADADLVSVFVDLYSLELRGSRRKADTLLGQLQDFHYALFAGEPGLKVNGVAALGLLALTVTGPILWWPRRGRWREALRVRRAPLMATWRDLHAVVGVLASLVLALITLTALYFAFRGTATAVVALASGAATVAPPVIARPDLSRGAEAGDGVPRELAPFDDLVAAARRAEPRALFDELRPARTAARPASLSFRLPGDSVMGRHRMFFDPVTAQVLRVDRHESLDVGGRMFANMAPWHYGSFGGRITQLLWFVAGLAPALLFGSGAWLWWRKRARRRAAP